MSTFQVGDKVLVICPNYLSSLPESDSYFKEIHFEIVYIDGGDTKYPIQLTSNDDRFKARYQSSIIAMAPEELSLLTIDNLFQGG